MERPKLPLKARVVAGVSLLGASMFACDGDNKAEPGVLQRLETPIATQLASVTAIARSVETPSPTPKIESPVATVLPRVSPTVGSSTVNKALRLDGNVDSVEYDGEKFNFQAPLRIDARIKRTESTLNIGGDAIIAKGENDAIAFFASLISCSERGMALIVDGKEPVCGPRVQSGIWKDVSVVFDGENVSFYQDGVEVAKNQWKGSIPIERGKLFVGKSPSGIVTQEFFGGDIDFIRVVDIRTQQVLFGPPFDFDFKDPVSGVDGALKGDAKLVPVN